MGGVKKLSFNQRYDYIRACVEGLPFNYRANANPKGVHLARNPEATPTFQIRWKGRKQPKKPGSYRNSTFGIALGKPEKRWRWVGAPDHRESHLRHKRGWKPNPLTRIAEQLPGKLLIIPIHKPTEIEVVGY